MRLLSLGQCLLEMSKTDRGLVESESNSIIDTRRTLLCAIFKKLCLDHMLTTNKPPLDFTIIDLLDVFAHLKSLVSAESLRTFKFSWDIILSGPGVGPWS